jgi:hypothetical protein
MPSPKAIEEFKELYSRRYGVLLSDAEALEQAGRLLRLYKAVYGNGGTEGTGEAHEKTIPA